MRVAAVVTLVSDAGAYGGPVSVAAAQLGELAARGHETVLLSLFAGRDAVPSRWDGVRLRARRARTLVPGTGFLGLLDVRLLGDLWREFGRADVVHVHAGRDLVSLAALGVAALRRRPVFVQTHGMVPPRGGVVARLFDAVYVPLARRARACLVLTEAEAADLATVLGPAGPPRVRLRNGVPSPPTPTPAPAPGNAPAPRRPAREGDVVFLARLHPRKRAPAFVEAAALVHAAHPRATFALYGPDEGTLDDVRALIDRNGLAGAVRYGGAATHDEALRHLAGAAVYVLPSFGEVFPMSLLEALAAGTPTVSTHDCGIAAELAGRGASVVTDGSPRALADAVLRLLTDPAHAHAVAEAGLRAVAELYSVRAVTDRLEELYREASARA